MLDSEDILKRLGYDFVKYVKKGVSPPLTNIKFSDLIPQLKSSKLPRCRILAEKNLYVHQMKTLELLEKGSNVVLRAGTGSGKTEAWFLYAAKNRVKTMAVYPTLALSNDQLERLSDYCSALSLKIIALDALRREDYVRRAGLRELRNEIAEADILVTNPAFLLNELKRIGAGKSSLLKEFLIKCGQIVLDEFDFYGPRAIAILFGMLEIIVEILNPKPQIILMTATLENAEEAAEILKSINGRKTDVVEGKAFHVENRTYLVLGKSLMKVWHILREKREVFLRADVGSDVLKALDDYSTFRNILFKVVETASALGITLPEVVDDPVEIISQYVSDDGLTLVFTGSISAAEENARRVAAQVGNHEKVATHHHLLLKTQRREIEEKARQGIIKIIFTPKTLSQGIDIGLVKRVVHLGLPVNVREFMQREGRKGRRPEIEWTETVIIPYSQWDRELLSRGLEVFQKWLNLPLEKTVVSRENEYRRLFKTLFAFQSPFMRPKLKKDDILFLRQLGLERDGELTRNGKNAWIKMNYYEFAPPYGIKRWRVAEDGLKSLEDISHVDMVEKFQPGAIDPSSDGVVVEMKLGGSRGRVVTGVIVESIIESRLRRHDALAPVLEEYERTKFRWGEKPDIRRDYQHGRIQSLVHLVSHLPMHGFGLFTEFPNRVEWRVFSNKRQVIRIGDKTYFSKLVKSIAVPTPTYGIYGDYTYGVSVEASPTDDPTLLRVGACLILLLLRRLHQLSLDLIKHDVIVLGERKLVQFYEGESACILPKLDWTVIRDELTNYNPDELDEILMAKLDEVAYSSFFSMKLDWNVARTYALKIVDYFLLRERLKLFLGDKVLDLPKPSTALKAVALTALRLVLREDLGAGLYSISLFDGEKTHHHTGILEFNNTSDDPSNIFSALSKYVNQGFKVLCYGLDSLCKTLKDSGLESWEAFIKGLNLSGKVVDVKAKYEEVVEKPVPMEVLETSLGLRREFSLQDIFIKAELEKRHIPSMTFIRSKPQHLIESIEKFLTEEARNIYIAWLVAKT